MKINDIKQKSVDMLIFVAVIFAIIAALMVFLPSPYNFTMAIFINILAFIVGIAIVREENNRIIQHFEEDCAKTYLELDIVSLHKERDALKNEIEDMREHLLKGKEAFDKYIETYDILKNEVNNVNEGFADFTDEVKCLVKAVNNTQSSWVDYINNTAEYNAKLIEEAAKAKEEFLALTESNAALKYENEGLEQKIEEKKALLKQDHIMVFDTPYYPSTFLSTHVHETYLPKYAKSVLGDKFLQVGNIVELSEDCFARIPGVGDQTIMAVKKLLAQHDLYLGCSDIICINGQWYTKG